MTQGVRDVGGAEAQSGTGSLEVVPVSGSREGKEEVTRRCGSQKLAKKNLDRWVTNNNPLIGTSLGRSKTKCHVLGCHTNTGVLGIGHVLVN